MASEAVEVETGRNPTAAVIWLHGLGADGHDFEPLVPQLAQPRERPLRFVFPHAPVRPVTLNNGYAMRAWYDIAALNRAAAEDERGIRASQSTIETFIRRENARGIASERIVLAGFSQGGAMALFAGTRYPQKLAGIMGLSCYLVLAARLLAERNTANDGYAHIPRARVAGPGGGAGARRRGAPAAGSRRLCGGVACLQHASRRVPAGGPGYRRVAAARAALARAAQRCGCPSSSCLCWLSGVAGLAVLPAPLFAVCGAAGGLALAGGCALPDPCGAAGGGAAAAWGAGEFWCA